MASNSRRSLVKFLPTSRSMAPPAMISRAFAFLRGARRWGIGAPSHAPRKRPVSVGMVEREKTSDHDRRLKRNELLRLSIAAAAAHGDAWIVGRVARAGCQHHHDGAHLHPAVEVDDVLIGHPNAAGGDRVADPARLIGAMDAEQRIPRTLVEVDST